MNNVSKLLKQIHIMILPREILHFVVVPYLCGDVHTLQSLEQLLMELRKDDGDSSLQHKLTLLIGWHFLLKRAIKNKIERNRKQTRKNRYRIMRAQFQITERMFSRYSIKMIRGVCCDVPKS